MSTGQTVRIIVGMLRGKIGEIKEICGGVVTVRHAQGTSTFRKSEIEVIQ